MNKKREVNFFTSSSSCDPRGIQTHNLLIRSQMLYSVELGDLLAICGCKGTTFLGNHQIFLPFFSNSVRFLMNFSR